MKRKSLRPNAERQPRAGRLAGNAQERSKTLPTEGSLSEKNFASLVKAQGITGDKTILALRLHFVNGLTRAEASLRAGINPSAITRAAYRLDRPACSECGRPLRAKPSSATRKAA